MVEQGPHVYGYPDGLFGVATTMFGNVPIVTLVSENTYELVTGVARQEVYAQLSVHPAARYESEGTVAHVDIVHAPDPYWKYSGGL